VSQVLLLIWTLVPLDILPPSESPSGLVYPQRGSGFAAYIVGGFIGLGILVLVTVWISAKPKRRPDRRGRPGATP
jgi:hypothetical protein